MSRPPAIKIHDWLEIQPDGLGGCYITIWNGPLTNSESIAVQGPEVQALRDTIAFVISDDNA